MFSYTFHYSSVAPVKAQVQRGHEAEKKVAALATKVSSLPGVQVKRAESLHYLTISLGVQPLFLYA